MRMLLCVVFTFCYTTTTIIDRARTKQRFSGLLACDERGRYTLPIKSFHPCVLMNLIRHGSAGVRPGLRVQHSDRSGLN